MYFFRVKKEKDQKEKVIGSLPGTCIQYTRLHLYTLHVCKHLFWVWQGGFFFLQFDKFCVCEEEEKEEKKKKKVMSSTSNVYMNWLKLNMKI